MRKNGKLGANLLLWDLGVDDVYDEYAVDAKIAQVDKTFHLVMIMEHFEESIILMKELLCWNYLDVTNLKLNSRKLYKVEILKVGHFNFNINPI